MTSVLSSVSSAPFDWPELAVFKDPACLWGDLLLDSIPEMPEKPWVPQPYDEEVLENFVVPSLGSLKDLEEHFFVEVVQDRSVGALGLQRFRVRFLLEDEEAYEFYRNTHVTESEHYQNFQYWEELRLLTTLKANPYKFLVDESGENLVVTLREEPTPIQMLQRFPFVWDQRGGLLGVKAHRAKMADWARTLDLSVDVCTRRVVEVLAQRMRERNDVEVSFEGVLPGCLVNVRLLDFEEEEAPVRRPSPATVAATVAATVVATVSAPAVAPRIRALDVLNRFPVAWKRDGPLHSIEVHRSKMASYAAQPSNRGKTARALEAEVKDALLTALQGCSDCEILPPPRGTAFFYIVRMLSPLRA